ncbi:MAG: hypothetical protein ABIG42_06040, partial [bacterium]
DEVGYEGDDSSAERIQHVEDKTFVLKGGYWVDSEYDKGAGLTEIKIEFMSDKYFDLLDQFPDIGDYLAVGNNVKLVWKGKVYVITSNE